MYLSTSEETDVLLRTIDDCEELVSRNAIDPAAAYQMIVRAASHHNEYPKTKEQKEAERKSKVRELTGASPETPQCFVEAPL